MPLKVVAAVLLTELTLVTPVALVRFKVEPVVTVTLTTSIPDMLTGVTLEISVAVKVSVPAPPASASLACHVWALDDKEASNESLPAPPVNVFTPVVSVLNWFPKKFNKHRHLACSHGLVFCVPPPFSDQNASKQAVER